MKPCSNRKQSLSLLASQSLETAESRELRTHLESCRACSAYFTELQSLCQNLDRTANSLPSAEPSPLFHTRLRQALSDNSATKDPLSTAQIVRAWLTPLRLALGVVIGLGLLALFLSPEQPAPPRQVAAINPPPPPLVPRTTPPQDIAETTTLLAYQRAFIESAEDLEALMTENERRAPKAVGSTLLALAWETGIVE